jgi:hypothetical protein
MLADGGRSISDLAVLRPQSAVFGGGRLDPDRMAGPGRYRQTAVGRTGRQLFDHIVGWLHQLVVTDTLDGHGPIQYLEARYRAHARVKGRIRRAENIGLGRFPSRDIAINAAWQELALTAIGLISWTKTLLLNPDLATAEPKKLRYRLLHVAARINRSGRRSSSASRKLALDNRSGQRLRLAGRTPTTHYPVPASEAPICPRPPARPK